MKIKKFKVARGFIAIALTMIALFSAPMALAQEATPLGVYKFWTAWQSKDANGVICYISSQPQKSQPENVNRGPIHFMIIHRKGLGTKNEVQTLIGYPINESSAPNVTIDGKSYPMISEGSAAWLANTDDEGIFVSGMKRGAKMVVKGKSERGTNTTDTYFLSGVTAAMKAIDKACS